MDSLLLPKTILQHRQLVDKMIINTQRHKTQGERLTKNSNEQQLRRRDGRINRPVHHLSNRLSTNKRKTQGDANASAQLRHTPRGEWNRSSCIQLHIRRWKWSLNVFWSHSQSEYSLRNSHANLLHDTKSKALLGSYLGRPHNFFFKILIDQPFLVIYGLKYSVYLVDSFTTRGDGISQLATNDCDWSSERLEKGRSNLYRLVWCF